jgi:hypothetical protein
MVSFITFIYRRRIFNKIYGIIKIYGETRVVYNSARKAHSDIERESLKSNNIKYVGDYNSTYLDHRYPQETLLFKILEERELRKQQPISIQFLHFSPKTKFVEIKSKELNYSTEEIRSGIISALKNSKVVLSKLNLPEDKIQIRHYEFQVLLRAIILDHVAFIGFFIRLVVLAHFHL